MCNAGGRCHCRGGKGKNFERSFQRGPAFLGRSGVFFSSSFSSCLIASCTWHNHAGLSRDFTAFTARSGKPFHAGLCIVTRCIKGIYQYLNLTSPCSTVRSSTYYSHCHSPRSSNTVDLQRDDRTIPALLKDRVHGAQCCLMVNYSSLASALHSIMIRMIIDGNH